MLRATLAVGGTGGTGACVSRLTLPQQAHGLNVLLRDALRMEGGPRPLPITEVCLSTILATKSSAEPNKKKMKFSPRGKEDLLG